MFFGSRCTGDAQRDSGAGLVRSAKVRKERTANSRWKMMEDYNVGPPKTIVKLANRTPISL